MTLPPFAIESDADLEEAVRDKTSYANRADELPGTSSSGQMKGVTDDAKRVLYMRTNSDDWYTDVGYGQALVALTAMKAKEAVENVNIQSYGIGDEAVSFTNADPDDSQQIQSWSAEVDEGLAQSSIEFQDSQSLSLSNTASYIG